MSASFDPTSPVGARVERATRFLARRRLEQPGLTLLCHPLPG
jgi:hypothetical protein